MSGYQPLKITGMATGLIQEREEFILPNDAYPVLENAFVWRERIKRKQGYQLLGRLQRNLVSQALGVTDAGGAFNGNIRIILGLEASAQIVPGTVSVTIGALIFVEAATPNGTLSAGGANTGTINYTSNVLTIITNPSVGPGIPVVITFSYFPGLPVMGLRILETQSISTSTTIAFDTRYAYKFVAGAWQEFIPGTTWTGTDAQFFWSTNYWNDGANPPNKLFWVTNDNVPGGDPIRYTNSITWTNFAPVIDAAGNQLWQCLCILPFRGRLVVFNTNEGMGGVAASTNYPQRIRWAAIGNPLLADAWRDDIRGKGGFLDIPTSEDIISVGFVRDNLVIFCERSTWQLRYTGRSIAPFQIEKVNSELGSQSTFSAVQFDTSLVGIGDKGIVECDSFKSTRIDIKIPDLTFYINESGNNSSRVHGIRDFQQRLAYWTYPFVPEEETAAFFPNRRLVYNYENDSWAIFTDSLTTLGTFQPSSGKTWANTLKPWTECNFPWFSRPSTFPAIIGGNQQGYVEYLDTQTSNDVSLFIQNITGNTVNPTVITSPNHNLATGQVIQITGMIPGDPFFSLNGKIFGIVWVDANSFQLWLYSPSTLDFTTPQLNPPGIYLGGAQMLVRDGFSIVSKKFNYLDEGQNIQLGFIDILMDTTDAGAITLSVFQDYDDSQAVNIPPLNADPVTQQPDIYFNSIVPTTSNVPLTPPSTQGSTKVWQRVFCPIRAAFITIEWTLSNAQLVGIEQESEVQIDAQILYIRKAGRLLPVGV